MESTIIDRETTSFRLRKDLLHRLREVAHGEQVAMEQWVEDVLMDAAFCLPNADTRAAIEEARAGGYVGTLDVSSYEAFVKSIDAIE